MILMVIQMVLEALKIMGLGVASVFAILALFFGLIKLMLAIFPDKNPESK